MATDRIANLNYTNKKQIAQGAEAIIYLAEQNVNNHDSDQQSSDQQPQKHILKTRPKKSYRIPQLDKHLRKTRTRSEIKALQKASLKNIPCPKIINSDKESTTIILEYIEGVTLKKLINFIAINCYGEICKTDNIIPAEDDSEDEGDSWWI